MGIKNMEYAPEDTAGETPSKRMITIIEVGSIHWPDRDDENKLTKEHTFVSAPGTPMWVETNASGSLEVVTIDASSVHGGRLVIGGVPQYSYYLTEIIEEES